ncbi:MAG: hemolysin XhlA family protein [Phocaeicola sp.]
MEDLRQMVIKMSEDLKEHKRHTDNRFDKQEVRFDKHENRMDKQDDRMDKMNDTQIKHGEQIAGILETLRDIKGDTVWLRRSVTGAVIGGTVTAIIGFIVFAIQNLN